MTCWATLGSLIFSDKKIKKRTTMMERKCSKDWMTVTQVVTVRGEEVFCMEVFRKVKKVML